MILYDNDRWLHTVFKWRGSVWPKVLPSLCNWLLYVAVSFSAVESLQEKIGSLSQWNHIFGICLSFLLIFRANQAYARYLEGRTAMSTFFSDLRDFVMFVTMHVHGGAATAQPLLGKQTGSRDPDLDGSAREVRIELVRLALALAVSLRVHIRMCHDGYMMGSLPGWSKWLVDWDRFRLKQLLNGDEFLWVDACISIIPSDFHEVGPNNEHFEDLFQASDRFGEMPADWPEFFEVDTSPRARPHTVIICLLRDILFRSMNDFTNAVPWGIKERFIPRMSKFLETAQMALIDVDKIITTPIPLPYAALCKMLLVLHMIAFPFSVDVSYGVFGSLVVPIVVVVFLLGIDAMAVELENPFGNDFNDLDITTLIHEMECDANDMLKLCGDVKGRERFVWRKVHPLFAQDCVMPVTKQIAFADCASEEVVPANGGTAGGGAAGGGSFEEEYGDVAGSMEYEDEE